MLKECCHRAVALLVAWSLILAVSAMVGRILDFQFWPALMVWVLVGLILMLHKAAGAPLPAGTNVDVVGAIHMLWWAARWPTRLRRN